MSEIIFTGTGDARHDEAVRYRARLYQNLTETKKRTDRTGQPVRKIVERVYTTNLRDSAEEIVSRNVWEILGKLFPGAVISARSAAAATILRPEGVSGRTGFVFLTGNYRRNVSLPGLEVRIAKGSGPQEGDIPFMGLHLASPARRFLENLTPSRDKGCGISRTAGRAAVEERLAQLSLTAGESSLDALREHARRLKEPLSAHREFDELDGIVEALLRSRPALLKTRIAKAVAACEPFDQDSVGRLNALFSFLASNPMPRRQDNGKDRATRMNTAFVEAHFSNYIEGTAFLISEAEEIVFGGDIPAVRLKDGHDVLATFRQVSDFEALKRRPLDYDSFIKSIKGRHAMLMDMRPEVTPGQFKTRTNRAGNTVFVHPDRVTGTLREGFDLLRGLDEPFARAVFVHFLISDVHPFNDGNGRLARIMMSSELVAGDLAKIVIPTVFRDDYIGGQRAMSRFSDAAANFRALDRAQEITAAIVEGDRAACINLWASTYAFLEPGQHAQLRAPDSKAEIVWRDGVPAPARFWESYDNPTNGWIR